MGVSTTLEGSTSTALEGSTSTALKGSMSTALEGSMSTGWWRRGLDAAVLWDWVVGMGKGVVVWLGQEARRPRGLVGMGMRFFSCFSSRTIV